MCSDARETCWRCDGEGGWFIRLHQGSAGPKWLDCEKCDGTGCGMSHDNRWCEALGVPAGTEPEDALRLVVERERAAVVAHLRSARVTECGRMAWVVDCAKDHYGWLCRVAEAKTAAEDIERGEHVRDQTTHPDPSSAASE